MKTSSKYGLLGAVGLAVGISSCYRMHQQGVEIREIMTSHELEIKDLERKKRDLSDNLENCFYAAVPRVCKEAYSDYKAVDANLTHLKEEYLELKYPKSHPWFFSLSMVGFGIGVLGISSYLRQRKEEEPLGK